MIIVLVDVEGNHGTSEFSAVHLFEGPNAEQASAVFCQEIGRTCRVPGASIGNLPVWVVKVFNDNTINFNNRLKLEQ